MRALVRTLLVTLSALLAVAVWVPGAFAAPTGVSTPAGVPAVGRSAVGPRSYLVTTPLEGRTARALANHAVADRYPAGSSVLVLCQSWGRRTLRQQDLGPHLGRAVGSRRVRRHRDRRLRG